MTIGDIFTFKANNWNIYYTTDEKSWRKIEPLKGYWYADPIVYKMYGEIYLFIEAFEKKTQIGRIAVSKYVEGEFLKPKIVISQPYHMSYPCVFGYDGTVYMIPETSQNRTIEMYKAVGEDLNTWQLDTVLMVNVNCVDSTIYKFEEKIYLYTYVLGKETYITRVYQLDMNSKKLTLIESCEHECNSYRPAGLPYESALGIIRPVQECKHLYGEKIRLLKINPYKHEWIGTCVANIDSSCITEFPVKRVHTIAMVENVKIIDGIEESIDFCNPFLVIRRKVHNLRYKIRNRNR